MDNKPHISSLKQFTMPFRGELIRWLETYFKAREVINTSSSGITAIASSDSSVTVTNPAGPSTNLSVKTKRTIEVTIDGGGVALTTGIKGDIEIGFAATITQWTLLADQSGSIVVNIWKDTYANYPPTVADKITASAPPTISSATKATDSTLTGWTTAVALGDTLRFNVDSVTTITRVTLAIELTV